MERSFIELKETEKKLESEENKLSDQIESLTQTIKESLRQGNKQLAMKYLKKRKQLEKSLEVKEGALNNIQTMLMSIHQADSNKMTYDVYTKSVDALKEASKGIKIDKLDDTMNDLQDIVSANSEIEDVLSRSQLPSKYLFDDNELSNELEELLAQNDENDQDITPTDKTDTSFDLSALLENLPTIPNQTPRKNTYTSVKSP